ncbi:MAG: nucleotidyltransferase [Fibrobacteria bacterium]
MPPESVAANPRRRNDPQMADKQASGSPPEMLDRVGRILDASAVQWATIGALAVAYHGFVRASLDADALISMRGSGMDLDALAQLLIRDGFTVKVSMGEDDDPLGFVVRILDTEGNQVDLIGGIKRLDPAFFDRALVDEFDGMKLRFASKEDLIALKVFAGGPKDIEDIKGILEVQGDAIAKDLALSLCRRFGKAAEELFGKLLKG